MPSKKASVWIALGIVAGVALTVGLLSFSCGAPKSITVSGRVMRIVEVCSVSAKAKGLGHISQEDFEQKADAMFFRFKTQEPRTFWMQGMQFSIDIVWLKDGEVVKIEEQIPYPKTGETPIRMHSQPFEVDGVLELPAGGVQEYGIVTGMVIPSLK